MKKYYAERNGLLTKSLKLSIGDIRDMFYSTYLYFYRKGAFNVAYAGVWEKIGGINKQIVSPTMAPSPDVYFAIRMQEKDVWPIDDEYSTYSENTLFSVMEIIYDHIGVYNSEINKIDRADLQVEYAEHINNLLKFYSEGYYLEPTHGFIMKMPNIALKEQLEGKCEHIPDDVLERMRSATQSFYRFDSDMETKKKAICTLADILENIREPLKETLNQEYQINKNDHDKVIFDVVNNFNIRHDKANQLKGYSRDIWYDWAMQYYTSVIIAYYKLDFERI